MYAVYLKRIGRYAGSRTLIKPEILKYFSDEGKAIQYKKEYESNNSPDKSWYISIGKINVE